MPESQRKSPISSDILIGSRRVSEKRYISLLSELCQHRSHFTRPMIRDEVFNNPSLRCARYLPEIERFTNFEKRKYIYVQQQQHYTTLYIRQGGYMGTKTVSTSSYLDLEL